MMNYYRITLTKIMDGSHESQDLEFGFCSSLLCHPIPVSSSRFSLSLLTAYISLLFALVSAS